ncbi:MAG: hypothetical protein ABR543_00880 [Gemmatimonadaceae bacterium]
MRLASWRQSAVRPSVLAVAFALFSAGCGGDPAGDVSLAQTIIEMTDAINDLRQDNVFLQQQIDSLATALAKQDSVVRQIANAAGMPMR